MIANHHPAGAAFARAAAEMRTDDTELPTQNIKQRPIGIGVDFGWGAVETKSDAWHGGLSIYDLPNLLTTSPHLTMSARRNLSNSSGDIDIGAAP